MGKNSKQKQIVSIDTGNIPTEHIIENTISNGETVNETIVDEPIIPESPETSPQIIDQDPINVVKYDNGEIGELTNDKENSPPLDIVKLYSIDNELVPPTTYFNRSADVIISANINGIGGMDSHKRNVSYHIIIETLLNNPDFVIGFINHEDIDFVKEIFSGKVVICGNLLSVEKKTEIISRLEKTAETLGFIKKDMDEMGRVNNHNG